MVATDGHRLYRQDIEAPEGFEAMQDVIIPRKTVELLHKLLKGKACPEIVTVTLDSGRMRFAFADVPKQLKGIQGTFPDILRVFQTRNISKERLVGKEGVRTCRSSGGT